MRAVEQVSQSRVDQIEDAAAERFVPERVNEPSQESDVAAAKRWPVLFAGLVCWLFPATAASRTQSSSLLRVYLLHVVMVVATALLALQFDAWGDSKTLTSVLSSLWAELEDEPPGAAWFIFFVFAAVEAFHLVVALLFMAWGARDEPLRRSFQNSLRQTWLHTVHFIVAIALVGGLAMSLHVARERWYAANPTYPRDTFLLGGTGNSDPVPPWYVDYPPGLIMAPVGALAVAWIVLALARAIGAPRRVPPEIRPPMCTTCGYNLTSMAMEGRCPECGAAVIDSLGPDAQGGTPWERRKGLGGAVRAWEQTARMAVAAPERLGRMVRLSAPPAHRSFLAFHMPLIFLIAAAALVLHFAFFEGGSEVLRIFLLVGCVASTFGVACVLATFALVNLGALLWVAKRNMQPAAIQVACYLAPYLVAWEVMGAVLILVIARNQVLFKSLEEATGINRDMMAATAFLVPNLIATVFFLYLVNRGTKAARYANK